METQETSLITISLICLAVLLPLMAWSLVTLRKRGYTAEINVIWYAFSLVFVIWWTVNVALDTGIISLPWGPPHASLPAKRPKPSPKLMSGLDINMTPAQREAEEQKAREADQRAREEDQKFEEEMKKYREEERRLRQNPQMWGRWLYQEAGKYLTDTRTEIGFVAAILIVTIVPQLLNYIFAGLSGCAAAPRYVWQFEKVAIWSLIKFLAAYGGFVVATAFGAYNFEPEFFPLVGYYLNYFIWGLCAVALAFVIAVLQIRVLDAAQALGDAWLKKSTSWPYRLHRFFTRNLPRKEDKPKAVEPVTLDASQIWDTLTPTQQQEIGALVVRSLLDDRVTAKAPSAVTVAPS